MDLTEWKNKVSETLNDIFIFKGENSKTECIKEEHQNQLGPHQLSHIKEIDEICDNDLMLVSVYDMENKCYRTRTISFLNLFMSIMKKQDESKDAKSSCETAVGEARKISGEKSENGNHLQ